MLVRITERAHQYKWKDMEENRTHIRKSHDYNDTVAPKNLNCLSFEFA